MKLLLILLLSIPINTKAADDPPPSYPINGGGCFACGEEVGWVKGVYVMIVDPNDPDFEHGYYISFNGVYKF